MAEDTNISSTETLLENEFIMVNQEDVGGISTMTSWNPDKIENVEDKTFGKLLKWFHQTFWKVKNEYNKVETRFKNLESSLESSLVVYEYTGDGQTSRQLNLKNEIGDIPSFINIVRGNSGDLANSHQNIYCECIFPGQVIHMNSSSGNLMCNLNKDGLLYVYYNGYSNMNQQNVKFKIIAFYGSSFIKYKSLDDVSE